MRLFRRTKTIENEPLIIPEAPADNQMVIVPKHEETIISDINMVPKGEYIEIDALNLPDDLVEIFAVIATDQKKAILLIAIDKYSQEYLHQHYELKRRLRERGYTYIENINTTTEIIKSLHSSNYRKNQLGAVECTDIEATVWTLIERAVEAKASDIHIETRGSYAKVYYRIYGERVQQPIIATKTAIDIANVLYSVHADSDNKDIAWDHRQVKNTIIDYVGKNGTRIQLRFSSAPIHPSGNFHMVIRLLVMDKTQIKSLTKIGYTPQQLESIENMLIGSQGMVLLVGPTNSGKSTSLQSFVDHIYKQRGQNIKVITVEDPVEYIMPEACQIGVPHGRKGLEDERTRSIFTTFLKATLRQDPDVVIIGEIRDMDSADAVKNLVLAGRKLLTTLHAYEAFAVFPRLREMGIPASILYMHGFISGVIYQRLLPVLCPHCAIPLDKAYTDRRIPENVYTRLMRVCDIQRDPIKVRGDGCEHCQNMGIVGRTVCAEILVPDSTMLDLISKGQEAQAREYWLRNAPEVAAGYGPTVLGHAIHRMKEGQIDPTDVEIYINLLAQECSEIPNNRSVYI